MPVAAVRYYPAAAVSAAFARGDVRFDGAGANYMVHASRRDAAGKAEVHGRESLRPFSRPGGGRLSCNWYRINVTVPPAVGDFRGLR